MLHIDTVPRFFGARACRVFPDHLMTYRTVFFTSTPLSGCLKCAASSSRAGRRTQNEPEGLWSAMRCW